MEKNVVTAGILFAGGGGVESGLLDAHIDSIWAVEWNPHNPKLSEALIHAHRRNFPDCKVIAKPVQQVDWRSLPSVDILWVSPPCSNFSPAKNAQETLEDIEMAMTVCDAIAILKPRYFFLENVPQYAKVSKKKERSVSFDAIVSTLERLGYSVEYSVENFADYGVPQARKRLIFRAALGVAVPPLPSKVEKHVGWYEAIADLIPDLSDSKLLPNQQQSVDKYLEKNLPVPLLIDRVGARGDYKVKPGHLPANTILRSQFTDGNNRNRNRCGDIRLLNGEIKSLTIDCVRRLQGFPDWYQMPETVAIAGSILGYSVPPLFVKQLFVSLLSLLKSEEIERIANKLVFGSETERFRHYLVEYLHEAFGLRESTLMPDITLFVNAQAASYSYQGTSEINDICGTIQLSPGRSSGGIKKKTITKIPESAATLDFGKCKILYDSLAFTDVLTQDRRSLQEALDRQLLTLAQMPASKDTWLVSYDLLIDEKFVDGVRKKQRWTVDEGWSAVEQTVAAAEYLDSQRHRLESYTLVMSCQGVDASQYEECVKQVLGCCKPSDVIGLGGWCILGRQPSYLKTFWETINRIIPLIAEAGIRKIHIFGVTWYKPKPGFDLPPLAPLLWLCDCYGINLSTDGTSPIGNALWKDWKKAGATHPYWRHNLAYIKAALATIRNTEAYQPPPGYKAENIDLSLEVSSCGLQISFGWTAQYLPNKTVTRRTWKDSHAFKFIHAYERGDRVVALNKDKRNGGEQIGWCKLTCPPYKERLADMPESDLLAEGGMAATVEEFIQRYFKGDRDREVWVVRFEFIPLEEKQSEIAAQQPKTCVERHPLDRYDSPHWFVTAIAPYIDLDGTIGECCVGGGVLARCLKEMGYNVWTNDINSEVDADYHHDVTCDRSWDDLPEADWIFTNPPYGDAAFKIVRNAYQHAKRGVVFLLRTTWDEPCEERAEWLFQHPTTRKLTLPRYKFRENKHGKLSVEASTIAAFVWDKQIPVLPSLSIPRDRIPLFHDCASNAPSWDEIAAFIIKELKRPPFSGDANEACIKNSIPTIFDTRLNVRGSNVIPPSGSLMFAPAHKLKNGEDGSLRCLYRWGEKKGSVWVTRSKHVPIGKVGRVKSAIASRQPIAEILELL